MTNFIPPLLIVLFVPFWLWMFWEMARNRQLSPKVQLYWTIGFVCLNVPTALYYYFTEYKK